MLTEQLLTKTVFSSKATSFLFNMDPAFFALLRETCTSFMDVPKFGCKLDCSTYFKDNGLPRLHAGPRQGCLFSLEAWEHHLWSTQVPLLPAHKFFISATTCAAFPASYMGPVFRVLKLMVALFPLPQTWLFKRIPRTHWVNITTLHLLSWIVKHKPCPCSGTCAQHWLAVSVCVDRL